MAQQTAYLDSRFQGTYKTKKALKDAIKAGKTVTVHSESFHSGPEIPDGEHVLVGPAPMIRNWYAQITVKDLAITKIK